MKVSEFRKVCDALSRFATTREKASGPESLIGVQKKGETLKFISGKGNAGMVVSVDEHDSEAGDYKFVIPARPVLQAAKILPARSEIVIRTDKGGVHLQAQGGGTIDISRDPLSLREAGFPLKPKRTSVKGFIDAKNLKRMSKLFKAIAAKVEVPTLQVEEGVGYAVVVAPGNRGSYANYRFPVEAEGNGITMAAYREFWDALTHFDVDAEISWDIAGVVVRSGNLECFSGPLLFGGWDGQKSVPAEPAQSWPILVATEGSDVSFTMERKQLLTAVKSQAPFDELNRITLEVMSGSVRVSPFGNSDGMDLPCETTGKSIRSVDADYLTALLNAMDSKDITLRWSGGVPAISLSSEDYGSWTILLAPVTL